MENCFNPRLREGGDYHGKRHIKGKGSSLPLTFDKLISKNESFPVLQNNKYFLRLYHNS